MMSILGGVVGAVVVGLAIAEYCRPLRHRVEPQLRRVARNLAIAGTGFCGAAVADVAVSTVAMGAAGTHRLSLVSHLPVSPMAGAVIGFLLLDYTFYLWHWLNHRVPIFWRFHMVHHIDRDLDVSTGIRFHFGELALSAGMRGVQGFLLGPDSLIMYSYQLVLFLSVLFHHSNLRLPIRWERALNRIVVTPRMHGIHHSIVQRETNSNFSSLLTCWDWLHGSLRLNIPQAQIDVGVPAYRHGKEITLLSVLTVPFRRQRPSWQFPTGEHPSREEWPVSRRQLLP